MRRVTPLRPIDAVHCLCCATPSSAHAARDSALPLLRNAFPCRSASVESHSLPSPGGSGFRRAIALRIWAMQCRCLAVLSVPVLCRTIPLRICSMRCRCAGTPSEASAHLCTAVPLPCPATLRRRYSQPCFTVAMPSHALPMPFRSVPPPRVSMFRIAAAALSILR